MKRSKDMSKAQLIQAILSHPDWDGCNAVYLKIQPKEWLEKIYDVSHDDEGHVIRSIEFE